MSKGLEALEKLTNYKCSRMSEKIECKKIIEKELKSLEIIKKRDFVDIKLLKKSKSMYEYNRRLALHYDNTPRNNDICLIQNEEEFELLKEVLL